MSGQVNFPGYEVLEVLGAGSAGTVYKARQISMERMVAIKVLPKKFSDDKDFIARFKSEAKVVARLAHPNVVTGIDVDEHEGHHYFVMEYIDGKDVSVKIKRNGPMDEMAALKIIEEMASALSCSHRNGIVHRDIKPANILLTAQGTAKLSDLGIAATTTEGGDGEIAGTPYYMSPEQARGKSDIDVRSDIYSLGATLYHMLAGKPPFAGLPIRAVIKKQITDEPAPIEELAPSIHVQTIDLIKRMMQKDPDKRPSTPEKLSELIAKTQKILAAAHRHQGSSHHRNPSEVKTGSNAPMIVLVALLLGGGAAFFATSSTPKPPKPPKPPITATTVKPPVTPTEDVKEDPQVALDKAAKAALDKIVAGKMSSEKRIPLLKAFINEHAGTTSIASAHEHLKKEEQLLAKLKLNKKLLAQKEKLEEKAELLFAQDKLTAALNVYTDSQLEDDIVEVLYESKLNLEDKIDERLTAIRADAKRSCDGGNFAFARNTLNSVSVSGNTKYETLIKEGLDAVDLAEKNFKAKQLAEAVEKASGEYKKVCTDVDKVLRNFEIKPAMQRIKSARHNRTLKPIINLLDQDIKLVNHYESVLNAIKRSINSRRNKEISLVMRDGSTMSGKVLGLKDDKIELARRYAGGTATMPVSLHQISLKQLSSLAKKSLGNSKPELAHKIGLFYAVFAEHDLSAPALEKAENSGIDVSDIRRRFGSPDPEQMAAELLAKARKSFAAKNYTETKKYLDLLKSKYSNTKVYKDNYKRKAPAVKYAKDLLAYWKFDSSSNNQCPDSSGKGMTATLKNGAALKTTESGKAVVFNGENAYVELPEGFNDINEFTAVLWVKPIAINSWMRFFSIGNGRHSDNIILCVRNRSTEIGFAHNSNSKFEIIISNGVTINQWQQLVVVNKNGETSIYKNATLLQKKQLMTQSNVLRKNNWLGKSEWESDGYFEGLMDEVQIYQKSLTKDDIKELFNASPYSKNID